MARLSQKFLIALTLTLILFPLAISASAQRRSNRGNTQARTPSRRAPVARPPTGRSSGTRATTPRPRRAAPRRRPQERPQPRPQERRRTAKPTRRAPQPRAKAPTRRAPQQRTKTPTRRTPQTRSDSRRRPATTPRQPTKRRTSTRVPSVKRYQGSSSTPRRDRPTPRSNNNERDTRRRSEQSRAQREASARRANLERTRKINERNRRTSTKRATKSTPAPQRRNGLTVSPLRRSSGFGTNRASRNQPSRGFGRNGERTQPNRLKTPTGRRADASRRSIAGTNNNPRATRRTTSNRVPTSDLNKRGANLSKGSRRSNRGLPTRSNLGRGGIATTDRNRRGARAKKTVARRPTPLRPMAAPKARAAVVQPLPAVPSRRLAVATTVNPAPRASHGGARRHNRRHRDSNLNFGLFFGGGGWGFGAGYSNYSYFNGGSAISFGFGGGLGYAGSYLHGAGYGPYWNSYYYGYRPGHLGIASPAHVYFGHQVDFRYRTRLHFGFNYFHPFATYTPYPFYRTSYFEPWYVNYFARRTPAYRTYYYVQEPPPETFITYVETADPFVDEVEVLDVAAFDGLDYDPGYVEDSFDPVSRDPIPVVFQSSFSGGVPPGQTFDEALAWGEEALFNGDYNGAAEAFRQAMKLRWDDAYPKFQLALALFGAERYDLAYLSLELGLDQNPAWIYRRFDVRDAFASAEEFGSRISALERYLIRNSRDDDARFVLGYCYFFSGNLFGARSVTRVLDDSPRSFPHLKSLASEAEKRLLESR